MAFKIAIDGVIGWDILPRDIRAELKKANGDPVEFEINSPGGFVSDGINIFNLIRDYEGETTAKINGMAASMASYIPLAADKVLVHDNAIYMIHNAWGFAAGDHNDMRKYADNLEGLSNLLSKAYAKKTGESSEKIKQLMDDETYFYGEDIFAMGFADDIIEGEKKEDQDDGLAFAKLRVSDCMAKIKEFESQDLEKVAALLKTGEPNGAAHSTKAPKAKTQTKQEEEMTPEEMLKNPEVMAAIAKAKEEGKAESKVKEEPKQAEELKVEVEEKKDPSEMAMDILESASYPSAIKAVAKAVLKGEQTPENLTAMAATFDMVTEMNKSAQAKEESGEIPETPGEQDTTSQADKEFKASTEAARKAVGKNSEVK